MLDGVVRPHATILVKASRGMALEELVDYCHHHRGVIKGRRVPSQGPKASVYPNSFCRFS